MDYPERKDIEKLYDQPWRYHHNRQHYIDMKERLIFSVKKEDRAADVVILFNAILFHDAVYEPFATDNEDKSVELWKDYMTKNSGNPMLNDEVSNLIMSTKHPEKCKTPLEIAFRNADWNNMGIVHKIDDQYARWLENYEDNIFREFQKVSVEKYVEGRMNFLLKSFANGLITNEVFEYLRVLVKRKRRIGIYAGSFLPFHVGHLNILRKAEVMFDKVIVAQGMNPEKKNISRVGIDNVSDILGHHQVEKYSGQLVDFVQSMRNDYCDPCLIRGLRNAYDLNQETNLINFLNEQSDARGIKRIPIIYIHCDKEFEHVSSSALRMLEQIDMQRYIPENQ